MIKAQATWDDILIAYPRDILALKMLSNHSIFVGPKDLLRDSVARVFPHWKQEIPLYGYSNGNCSVDSVKFQHYHEKKLNSIFIQHFENTYSPSKTFSRPRLVWTRQVIEYALAKTGEPGDISQLSKLTFNAIWKSSFKINSRWERVLLSLREKLLICLFIDFIILNKTS